MLFPRGRRLAVAGGESGPGERGLALLALLGQEVPAQTIEHHAKRRVAHRFVAQVFRPAWVTKPADVGRQHGEALLPCRPIAEERLEATRHAFEHACQTLAGFLTSPVSCQVLRSFLEIASKR